MPPVSHRWIFGSATLVDRGVTSWDPMSTTCPTIRFFYPRIPWESTPAVDIFSLGSIVYTILTGCWPYRDGPSPVTVQDKTAYEIYVNQMFAAGMFPDVSMLRGGNVIQGCWKHRYTTAEQVLWALKSETAAQEHATSADFSRL